VRTEGNPKEKNKNKNNEMHLIHAQNDGKRFAQKVIFFEMLNLKGERLKNFRKLRFKNKNYFLFL
jgi:hypothetical protein